MSQFAGMEDLLQDFLAEAGELLADVDNKLVDLEKHPQDKDLLNNIFRGFHTIKGGAGFLNVTHLVALCHRTENLFDKLRTGELKLDASMMDAILAATATVRHMMDVLGQSQQPGPADAALLEALDAALEGRSPAEPKPAAEAPAAAAPAAAEPDWDRLYEAVTGARAKGEEPAPASASAAPAARAANAAPRPAPAGNVQAQAAANAAAMKENTIRVDTARLDMVLNLSGEIGLTKNRLNCLRASILSGQADADTLKSLDAAVGQLDLLVSNLQNAVMKTRMQPIGRLFQKYPRLVRDLARQLGKDVELVLSGEATELDKTMIEDLNDPLVHLLRNAVDHGVDSPAEREAAGKQQTATVRMSAEQAGDHIVIEISDDGRGMRPDVIRAKAVEKGVIDAETANSLDDRQSLNLIFLPGFSTKDQISDVSGRGVGMDVVKTNIQKLNGRIDVKSVVGQGTTFTIALPLTLAIMPVLIVQHRGQPFAVPLSMVREIVPLDSTQVQWVSGNATLVLRDEVLPVRTLGGLIGFPESETPRYGVLMQCAETSFVLAIDGFVGRDDVVIKPLDDIRPRGVAGATLSGDGSVVLILDMEQLLAPARPQPGPMLLAAA